MRKSEVSQTAAAMLDDPASLGDLKTAFLKKLDRARALRDYVATERRRIDRGPYAPLDRWFLKQILFIEHEGLAERLEKECEGIRYWIIRTDPKFRQEFSRIEAWQDRVDEVRETSLLSLVEQVTEARPAGGGRYKACCSIHGEKTPSFVIYPDNHAHCFGCGWHGDAIRFVMDTQKLGFREAIAILTS